ncbi:hypothetical protein Tco_1193243 [Tanacetum coccineum]
MPQSSQQHIKIERIGFDCGRPVACLNCPRIDLTRKILRKLFKSLFKILPSHPMNNSNLLMLLEANIVVKQDPSVNSSQKSPLIDQKCCYECGDSLDGIFCQQCTCKSCGKGAHVGYNCPPKTLIISNPEPTKQTINEIPQARKVLLHAWDNFIEAKHAQPEEVQELLSKLVQDVKIISDELSEYINTPAWNRPLVYCDDDDDEDYTIAITPVLSTEEPVNSLNMGDEHLDTIPATESDEFIKSSVEILIPIPSESAGVPKVCDVPVHDNSPPLDISKDQSEDFSDSNVDSTSTDEDSFSSNDVEYVEASPPNSEPVSSKVMEISYSRRERIEDDILLIKDDTLHYKAFYIDNDHFKEKSSGSSHYSMLHLSQYDRLSLIFRMIIFPPTVGPCSHHISTGV